MPTFKPGLTERPRSTPMPDELADALDVDRHERIDGENLLLRIGFEDRPGIVAAQPQRRLRQVVGAEREERRAVSPSAISAARSAARGSSIIVPMRKSSLRFGLLLHGLGGAQDDVAQDGELRPEGDERHHDLELHRLTGLLLGGDRRFEDGARLHLG